jgi:hypothetical protein
MGLSFAREPVFRGVSFMVCPFYTKIITAGLSIAHVDVGHIAILEQTADLGVDDTIRNIPLRNQPPAGGVCIEGEMVGKHVRWKSAVLGIPFAFPLVDENGTREGQILLPME